MSEGRVPTGGKTLEWVRVLEMRVSPRAQRGHNKPGALAKIDEIAAEFDPDKLGVLTVNERDGTFWVIDGGHRLKALIKMGYEDQMVQCWTYHGLTEKQEADLFLDLNNVRVVSAMDKFKVAVVADRGVESQINAIVQDAGLSVGTSGAGSVNCVAALRKVYAMGGGAVLERTLRIIRDAYGKPGFSAKITEGVGLFVSNYEHAFDEDRLISKLSHKLGGVNGLLSQAAVTKSTYGVTGAVAVAASVVETYNQGRGGVKLPAWWSKTSTNVS